MTRQRPFAEDIATGTPTAGLAPISAGPGAPPAWGAAGGGGGGGVWTQIDQQIAVGGESTLDFTGVPATYDTLVAIGDSISAETDTTSAGEPIRVEFNEWDGSDYLHREHYFRSIGAGDAHGMQGATSQALEVGRAPWSAADGVGSFVAWFPGYAVAGTYKNVHSSGGYGYGNGVNGLHTSGFARLNLARSDVIDHLLFFMGAWSGAPTRTFAAGSRITLYGLKDGSGGGADQLTVVPMVVTNGGTVLADGDYDVFLDFGYTIQDWILAADQVGDVTVGVSTATFAAYPTFTDIVGGGAAPSLSGVDKAQGSAGAGVTGWTTTVPADRFVRFSISGAVDITRLGIYLLVTRTS